MNCKKILTVTLLCIVTLLFASISGLVIASDSKGYETEYESMSQYDRIFLENQEMAHEAYSKLNQSFGEVGNLKASDYPNYYGGAFTNDDGKLVIYVKGEIADHEEDFKKRAGTNEIDFKTCEYSFKELTEIMDAINDYKLNKRDNLICDNFNNYALMDRENRIIVQLEDYGDEQIAAFKEQIIDSPAIEFKKSSAENKFLRDVKPGEELITINGDASVGYRAKYNDIVGLVTAGHVVNLTDYILDEDFQIYGRCLRRQVSGPVDAAFYYITDSSFTPSNTIDVTGYTLSTTISEPGVSTVINKVGAASGHTSGTITTTNATVSIEGYTLTNLTGANMYATEGDSGGIVYSVVGSSRYTLGIICGKSGSTTYYVKANQINSSLSLIRY